MNNLQRKTRRRLPATIGKSAFFLSEKKRKKKKKLCLTKEQNSKKKERENRKSDWTKVKNKFYD